MTSSSKATSIHYPQFLNISRKLQKSKTKDLTFHCQRTIGYICTSSCLYLYWNKYKNHCTHSDFHVIKLIGCLRVFISKGKIWFLKENNSFLQYTLLISFYPTCSLALYILYTEDISQKSTASWQQLYWVWSFSWKTC